MRKTENTADGTKHWQGCTGAVAVIHIADANVK